MLQRYMKSADTIPILQWSDNWHGHFYSVYVETFPAFDTSAVVFTLKRSTGRSPHSALALFGAIVTDKRFLVRYYYW